MSTTYASAYDGILRSRQLPRFWIMISSLAISALSGPLALEQDLLERDFQTGLCADLLQNCYLPNGTYVDCISSTHAIEVEFSQKWAEAIGQALMYASELKRRPEIILICRPETSQSACPTHAYLIEQTVTYWRIGMSVWCSLIPTAVGLLTRLSKDATARHEYSEGIRPARPSCHRQRQFRWPANRSWRQKRGRPQRRQLLPQSACD